MRKADHNNPSSTFFWKDYENDEGLRVSSLAAQGLWMRLLCVAAKADPYGYVLINGCEIGVTGVARLGSVSETEAATLLDELERNGVFSRDRRGRIFSRRMLKEAATRKKARENGKKGGNPALYVNAGKVTEKSDPVNLQDNPPDKPPYPIPFPSSSLRSEDTGRGVAQARDHDPDLPPDRPPEDDGLQWRIIHALGFDRGQVTPKFWMAPDAPLIIGRWQTDLGLTEGEIVEVARQNSIQHGEPARGPKILVPAMQAYAAAKNAPPLQPSEPRRTGNALQSEQRAFDHAVNRLADGLAAGTVNLDTASRDPWEYARRNGGS